jgi:hypothetical protein
LLCTPRFKPPEKAVLLVIVVLRYRGFGQFRGNWIVTS